MDTLFCKNREEWRIWLKQNHLAEKEIWLIYYKKHTKKESIIYNEAVEEALCFGWIDSLVKRIDDETYMQKYTPRKPKSVWSLVNKKRVEKMIHENKMTKVGMEKVEFAKKSGWWEKAYSSKTKIEMPKVLLEALKASPTAFTNFYNFPPSSQNNYIGWVLAAKREDTIKRRVAFVIERSEKNLKPGMI